MIKLLSAFVFLYLISATADTQSNSSDSICKLIDHDPNLAVQCLLLTSGKYKYQLSALDLCSDLNEDQSVVSCLKVVADKSFNEVAVNTCNTAQSDQAVIECLTLTADRGFHTEAMKLCASLPYTPNKLICAKITANQTFQTEAVKFCSNLDALSDFVNNDTSDLRNRCLSVISNRTFTAMELSVCGNLYNQEKRVECLRLLPNNKAK